MSDNLISCEFRVKNKVVESVKIESVPRVGERIEVGTMFNEGERVDPSDSDTWHDIDSEYQTVLSGVVTDVTRHYSTAPRRSELTAYIDIDVTEE